jgi:CheY-like chemotaxis protein
VTERLIEHVVEQVPDDRDTLSPEDACLLIVEDDPHYARILVDLGRDSGFRVVAAHRGGDALALARQYRPAAISLDIFLPDMLGWSVLSQLKQDPVTRHIPVQIVSLDEDRQHGLARGAFAFVTKPASNEGLVSALSRMKDFASARTRRLLIVEDDPAEQMSIRELLSSDDLEIDCGGFWRYRPADHAADHLRLRRPGPSPAGDLRVPGAGNDAR